MKRKFWFSTAIVVTAFSALAVSAEEPKQGWIIEQNNPQTGGWKVYLSDDGMKNFNESMMVSLSASAPDWDVIMYNDDTKVYFFSRLSEWRGPQPHEAPSSTPSPFASDSSTKADSPWKAGSTKPNSSAKADTSTKSTTSTQSDSRTEVSDSSTEANPGQSGSMKSNSSAKTTQSDPSSLSESSAKKRPASTKDTGAVQKPEKISETTFLGHPTGIYLADIRATQELKRIEFSVAEDIEVPPPLQQILGKIYGVNLTGIKGVPLSVSFVDENNKHRSMFTTTKISRSVISTDTFHLPEGYQRLESEIDVLMDRSYAQVLSAIADEGLYGGDDLRKLLPPRSRNASREDLLSKSPGTNEPNVKPESKEDDGDAEDIPLPIYVAGGIVFLVALGLLAVKKKLYSAGVAIIGTFALLVANWLCRPDWNESFQTAQNAYSQGNLDSARKGFYECALLARKSYGEKSEKFSDSLKHLGWIYEEEGMYGRARHIIAAVKGLSDKERSRFATAQMLAYAPLGQMNKLVKRGTVDGAQMSARTSLNMMQRYIAADDPGLVPLYSLLAETLSAKEDFAGAQDCLLKIQSIRQSTQGPTSTGVADARVELADLAVLRSKKPGTTAYGAEYLRAATDDYNAAIKIYSAFKIRRSEKLTSTQTKLLECENLKSGR